MQENKVVIRKYENRRLYDTAASRYVNLEDVARMVREGTDVQVLDARTGEDLTRVILTQIIVENAKEREFALPLDLLRQMVVASGKASQEGFTRYMKAVFDMYQTAYRAFPAPVTPLDFVQSILHPPRPHPGGPAPAPAAGNETGNSEGNSAESAEPSRELTELRRRVEELERRLTDVSAAPSKPGRKRRPAK